MATKECLTPERGAFMASLCSDHFGSEATKDKQLSFAYASHVCECQSYRRGQSIIQLI